MDTSSYTYKALQKKYVNFITPALEVTIGNTTYSSKEIPILNLEVELTADGSAGGCTFTVDSQYKAEASRQIGQNRRQAGGQGRLCQNGGDLLRIY